MGKIGNDLTNQNYRVVCVCVCVLQKHAIKQNLNYDYQSRRRFRHISRPYFAKHPADGIGLLQCHTPPFTSDSFCNYYLEKVLSKDSLCKVSDVIVHYNHDI